MNKHRFPIYSPLTFLLLAVSCSQDEGAEIASGNTPTEKGRIEFRASLPEISSRATEVTADAIDNIQVSSFIDGDEESSVYFLDKTFTRNAETGTFYSNDGACIWPNNRQVLRFAAFTPACASNDAADGYLLPDFTLENDIASQVDFVTAIGYGNLWDNEETPVELTFRHQLSRIELKAFGNSKYFDVEIAGVRIGGIATHGAFDFTAFDRDADGPAGVGSWQPQSFTRGAVEYVFRAGDRTVTLDKTAHTTSQSAVSILGAKVGDGDGYENSAMLIPADYAKWDYKMNPANGDNNAEGMYFSVLMRVTDDTPYARAALVYPYADSSAEAAGMEVIYLAVDKDNTDAVKTRLYPNEGKYFTDPAFAEDSEYDPESNSAVVKTFGWAALPVADKWQPGLIYTYTLDYTNGVGLHAPTDSKPGEPILSDRVLINVSVAPWGERTESGVNVPRK